MKRFDWRPVADALAAQILAADLSPDDEVILVCHVVDQRERPAEPMRRSMTHVSRHMIPWLKTVPNEVANLVRSIVEDTLPVATPKRGKECLRVVDYHLEFVRHAPCPIPSTNC